MGPRPRPPSVAPRPPRLSASRSCRGRRFARPPALPRYPKPCASGPGHQRSVSCCLSPHGRRPPSQACTRRQRWSRGCRAYACLTHPVHGRGGRARCVARPTDPPRQDHFPQRPAPPLGWLLSSPTPRASCPLSGQRTRRWLPRDQRFRGRCVACAGRKFRPRPPASGRCPRGLGYAGWLVRAPRRLCRYRAPAVVDRVMRQSCSTRLRRCRRPSGLASPTGRP